MAQSDGSRVAGSEETRVSRDCVLELRNITKTFPVMRALDGVNFTLGKSEILALMGLVGAGRTEMCEAIYGATPYDEGKVKLNGQEVHFKSPAEAIAAGFALLPEGRQKEGLVLKWEWILVALLIVIHIMNSNLPEYYLTLDTFINVPMEFLDKAFIVFPMIFVVISGNSNIDISVGSTVALSSVIMGVAYNHGLPMGAARAGYGDRL